MADKPADGVDQCVQPAVFGEDFFHELRDCCFVGDVGDIAVEARRIEGNVVEVDIVDSEAAGPDIGEFRRRFRSAAGRDGGGFGLGLSIAEQSLEVMGGQLLLNRGEPRIQLPQGSLSE